FCGLSRGAARGLSLLGAALTLVCACDRRAARPSPKTEVSASGSDAAASSGPSAAPVVSAEPSARELSQAASARLSELPAGDVSALVVLLGESNRYLRAGALSQLVRHAPRLSRQQLRVVVELLGDSARVTSGSCLGYDSNRRAVMGQGQMLHAAQCARYHSDTVRERALAVLQAADTASMAPELVRTLTRRR